MSKTKLKQPQSGLRAVGSQHILLTEAESRCFFIARDYQRKSLLRSLIPFELSQWSAGFDGLGWSKNPLVLAIQWLVLTLALIPMCVWLLVKCCLRWVAFPFRYLGTFSVPKDLSAPGEKTLVGIHNAFGRHLDLNAGDYIACLNDWIKILYGEETSLRYNLNNAIKVELDKNKIRGKNEDLTTAMRSLVAVSREKISKELGHYGQVERLH